MQRHDPNDRVPRVCIVGAGISGLRAAGALISKGFDVTILEARNRIGGRLHQSSQLGPTVDLGANWIHGTVNNPIVKLARATQTVTSPCGAVHSIFDSSGKWMEANHAKNLYETTWDILDEAYRYSAANSQSIPSSARMMDFFREKVATGKYDPEVQEKLLEIVEMWGTFMATECGNQSLKFFWLDQGIDGDNLFVASTFKNIIDHVAQPVVKGGTVRLASEVLRIEQQLRFSGMHAGVIIETANGSRELFDEVVVTAPLGWLKRNQSAFSPCLPPRLAAAIDSIGFGNLDKVYITFPRAFWIHTDLVCHGDGPPTFPVETLFLHPKYASDTNPAGWMQEMLSFALLPQPYAHRTVMFYVFGEWGAHITGLVRGMAQDSPEYYQTLKTCFEPYYSCLPNFDASSPDCVPKAVLSSDWQNDKFAGYGSYCNYQVGLEDGARDIEIMREGMGFEGGIWFAGEHTAPFPGLGTVSGAYWSGERVANDISKVYGRVEARLDMDVDEDPGRHTLRGATPQPEE